MRVERKSENVELIKTILDEVGNNVGIKEFAESVSHPSTTS